MAKARCSGCPQPYAVSKDGTIRKHARKVWDGHKPGWVVTDPCPGAGRPPVGLEAPAAAVLAHPPRGHARGAMEAQRKAYAKLGLAWPPKPRKPRA